MLLELINCSIDILEDTQKVITILENAAIVAKATIVNTIFHKFEPYGISGVIIISQSHITIHTWPEYRYAAIDIFTCSNSLATNKAVDYLIKEFKAEDYSIKVLNRGIPTIKG